MSPALQLALVTDLLSCQPVTDIVAKRIYDNVPDQTVYPYIRIGDAQRQSNDDKATYDAIWTVPLHFWSQERGKKEAELLMQAVFGRLHYRPYLWMSGGQIVQIYQTFSTITTERDQLTRHGTSSFRVYTI